MTQSRIDMVKELHNRVIHGAYPGFSEKTIRAEERQMWRIEYSEAHLICEECFAMPK
jgi:hypothetical protein